MKSVLLSATLALALAGTAQAQSQSQDQSEPIPESQRVAVPAHNLSIDLPARPYRMWREEFKQFAGGYDLSNGDTLELRREGAAMYARIGKQEEHRIIASSRNAFVALDRKLKVRIDHHDDGSVGGELVMVVPAQNLAGGGVTQERIASTVFAGR